MAATQIVSIVPMALACLMLLVSSASAECAGGVAAEDDLGTSEPIGLDRLDLTETDCRSRHPLCGCLTKEISLRRLRCDL